MSHSQGSTRPNKEFVRDVRPPVDVRAISAAVGVRPGTRGTERDGRHSRPGSGCTGRSAAFEDDDGVCVIWGEVYLRNTDQTDPAAWLLDAFWSSRDGRPRRSQRLLSGRRRPRRPRGDRRDRSRPELGVLLRGRARHALFRDRRGDGRANDPVTGRGCRPLDEFSPSASSSRIGRPSRACRGSPSTAISRPRRPRRSSGSSTNPASSTT